MTANDKIKHAVAGIAVFILCIPICFVTGIHAGFALIPVLIAGAAKEAVDAFTGNTVDILDFFATISIPTIVTAIML